MKKLILSLIFFVACAPAFAANRYAVCADGGNLISTACWSTSSGGASGASVPGTSDTAIMDANSNDMTLGANDTTAWGVLDATNYTGTVTISSGAKITSRGSITIGASATFTGDGILEGGYSTTAGTWNITGTVNCIFQSAGTGAKTMSGSITIGNEVRWTGTCNLVGSGYTLQATGWNSSSYFNDAATNPTVKIVGPGVLTGTLPNSAVATIIEPSGGDVTFTAGTTYQTDVREATALIINASTYDTIHSNAVTRFITFSGSIDINDTDFSFDTIQAAGLGGTQQSDIKCNNLQAVTGAVTIVGTGYKILVAEDWISYGVCTWGGTNVTVEMTGTGDFHTPVTVSGSSSSSTVTINCNVNINASGTITHYGKQIYWGNGGTLTKVAGTFDTSAAGIKWTPTTGGYTFDCDVAIPEFSFESAVTSFVNSDFDPTILRLFPGATYSPLATKTTTMTNIYSSGTDLSNNYITGRRVTADLKNTYPATLIGAVSSSTPIVGATGNSLLFPAGTYATIPQPPALSTFTIAFRARGTPSSTTITDLLSGSTSWHMYIAFAATKGLVLYGSGSWLQCNPAGGLNWTGDVAWIVTKAAADTDLKLYRNGTYVSWGYSNSSGSSYEFKNITTIMGANNVDFSIDDVLIFDTVKDATFIANYSAGQSYDGTEAGLVAGWKFDDGAAETKAYLNKTGDLVSGAIANTDISDISATGKKLMTWHGAAARCENVYEVDEDNIKTLAYASA